MNMTDGITGANISGRAYCGMDYAQPQVVASEVCDLGPKNLESFPRCSQALVSMEGHGRQRIQHCKPLVSHPNSWDVANTDGRRDHVHVSYE